MHENYVKWSVFIWVVGIVTIIIGALFGIQISLMTNISEIKSDLSSIKTDMAWVKQALHNPVTKK